MSHTYSDSSQMPNMFAQNDPMFQRQQPQRYHSLQHVPGSQIPVRQHSFHHEDFPRPQQQQQHHLPHRLSPMRGRLSHTQSANFVPTRFSERIPAQILEHVPLFYNEQPLSQHRSFMADNSFRGSVEDPPGSPIPNEINLFERTNRSTLQNTRAVPSSNSRSAPAFLVTPEATNSSISLPESFELQLEYQHTLKRLGHSMRRSDVTRALVNCQRSGCSQMSHDTSERSTGAFGPNEPADVEEAR